MTFSLLALLLASTTNPPFEGATVQEQDLICVWTGASGETRLVHAEVWLDTRPGAVVAALSDWDRLGELLPNTKSYEVREKGEGTARIYRLQDTPPLFPKVWIEADATVSKKDDVTRVRLTRRDGTPKIFVNEWEVSASPFGTSLRYRVQMQPPFTPPRFFLERMQRQQVAEHVERLRARLGAKLKKPPKRCD